MPITLSPCSSSPNQYFFVQPGRLGRIIPRGGPTLSVGVVGGNSANRTPLVLQAQKSDPGQLWTALQNDTTPYDWSPVVVTAGSYAFKGFGGKCLDIGGNPHPDHSPAMLYGCNGSVAQFFAIKPANEQLGYYNITAFDRCLDISGSTPRSGAGIELNACSGTSSQQFSFDSYDRHYIFAAGMPELVIGVRGAATVNRTPLELQTRALVDYQDWQPFSVDNPSVGPKAPVIRFVKEFVKDHRGGNEVDYYVPRIDVRVDSAMSSTTEEIFWKPLSASDYSHKKLFRGGQIVSATLPEIKDKVDVYMAKARVTAESGLFSESPLIILDARQLETPSIWIENIKSDEVTVGWRSVGTPQASSFLIHLDEPTHSRIEVQVQPRPGTGLSNLTYSQRVTGLRPNTKYDVYVEVKRDFWAGIYAQTNTMTMPMQVDKGPFTTSIWMNRQEIVEGPVPYAGTFGPIFDTAVISNVNFPAQFPAVLLVKPGHSTANCDDPSAVVLVQGDMTADQKKAIWGTSTLSITGQQTLNFVGCSTSPTLLNLLPVNVTWHKP
jgi:hypothetical protein